MDWDFLYLDSMKHKGFMSKLIDDYVNPKISNEIKFWLGSNIEIMMRGNNPYIQLYFARKNAYESTIKNCLTINE